MVDSLRIMNRLKLIESDKWKQIIAIGEQTQRLSYKEISTIKIVLTKLRKKEIIDFKRMEVVDKALDKIKGLLKV